MQLYKVRTKHLHNILFAIINENKQLPENFTTQIIYSNPPLEFRIDF